MSSVRVKCTNCGWATFRRPHNYGYQYGQCRKCWCIMEPATIERPNARTIRPKAGQQITWETKNSKELRNGVVLERIVLDKRSDPQQPKVNYLVQREDNGATYRIVPAQLRGYVKEDIQDDIG